MMVNSYINYLKNIYLDYYEVFKEVKKDARSRPLRAALYGAGTLFVLNLFRTNEGLRSYSGDVVDACNRLAALTEEARNPLSNSYISRMGELNGHNRLRQLDLGFSTLIYKTDSNPEVALYRHNCSYLKPSIRQFFEEHLVDIGLLGHWFNLERKMIDYDINEAQYEDVSYSKSTTSSDIQPSSTATKLAKLN